MKNFSLEYQGKEYWISRSAAVIVIAVVDDKFIAVKRGKGTPDPEFVGSWCLPCGYVDYDETLREAAARELKEETGIVVNPKNLHLVDIGDDPKSDKRQNITFVYLTFLPETSQTSNEGAEKDEVDDIRWFTKEEALETNWAFNHIELIKRI